jgi:hypothetical protein
MKKQQRKARRRGRLNFVIDQDLKEWAHGYAERHHTNLTYLIISYLAKLKNSEKVIDVEQI